LALAFVAGLFVKLFPASRKRMAEPPVKLEIPSSKTPIIVPASVVSVSTTQNLPTLLE
jgi:hypothetical protein